MPKQFSDRRRDGDAHLLWCNSYELHAAEESESGKIPACGEIDIHQHHGRSAVGELRCIAGSRRATFDGGLECQKLPERGVGTRPFVVIESDLHHPLL